MSSEPESTQLSLKDAFNPFSEGTSPDLIRRYFVGREHYLLMYATRLAGLRASTPNHFYVTGVHGTGKTTFLTKLKEIADAEGMLAVLTNPDDGASEFTQIGSILRSIIQELDVRIASLRGSCSLITTWNAGTNQSLFRHPTETSLETDSVLHDLKVIQQYIPEAKVSGIVICVDEGQRLRARVLSILKNTLQHLSTFLVIISLRLDFESPDPVQAGRALLDSMAQQAEKDYGASRFLVNGISMGPFDTDEEASACIQRRLEGNALSFATDVIELLARTSGRIPRSIIEEASVLYELALSRNVNAVSVSLFQEAFRQHHHDDILVAATLCGSISFAARKALRGLLQLKTHATPETIASFLYPGYPPEILTLSANGIRIELDRIVQKSSAVLQVNEEYGMKSPVLGYCLELALGAEA